MKESIEAIYQTDTLPEAFSGVPPRRPAEKSGLGLIPARPDMFLQFLPQECPSKTRKDVRRPFVTQVYNSQIEILLTKLAASLVYPMGLFSLLVLVSLLLRGAGRGRLAGRLLLAGALVLLTASVPRVAQLLAGHLERQYPPLPVAALPEVEVAVMLGGVLALPQPPRIEAELVGSSDRILHAFRIARQGKAERLYLVGGAVFGDGPSGGGSGHVRRLLAEWGLPGDRVDTGSTSRTTRENALEARDYLAERGLIDSPVMLITSALHMPRAVAVFRTAGIRVVPVATDVRVAADPSPGVFDWVPSAAALQLATAALHEIAGLCYYRWRGWALVD